MALTAICLLLRACRPLARPWELASKGREASAPVVTTLLRPARVAAVEFVVTDWHVHNLVPFVRDTRRECSCLAKFTCCYSIRASSNLELMPRIGRRGHPITQSQWQVMSALARALLQSVVVWRSGIVQAATYWRPPNALHGVAVVVLAASGMTNFGDSDLML